MGQSKQTVLSVAPTTLLYLPAPHVPEQSIETSPSRKPNLPAGQNSQSSTLLPPITWIHNTWHGDYQNHDGKVRETYLPGLSLYLPLGQFPEHWGVTFVVVDPYFPEGHW